MCNICKREVDEFKDMIPKGCGKHSFHKRCLAKQLNGDELPFFAVYECFWRASKQAAAFAFDID
jgi:hypothetical protein